MPTSFEYADNGGRNRLFHNDGGRFVEVTEEMGVGSTRWTLAAASADFNDDGWPDLYLANDYGPESLYLNRRGESFELTEAGLGESGSGMSVALGDLHNRGRLDVYVTNISQRGYLFQGNNLRTNFLEELGRFNEDAEGAVADAGWAWGAQFGDLNSDGRTDLFVVNGFISESREEDYWYSMSKITGANRAVIEDAANWPPIGDKSLSGYQRSRVLVNRGQDGLVDAAYAVGVDDRLDGRAVALADLFNQGELDAVVANQEGPALVYRNRVRDDRHWVEFRLVGAARGDTAQPGRTNRSAIGTRVTVGFDGRRRADVVTGGSGFAAQNDRRLFFGLGGARRVDSAVVEWTSGRREVLHELEADR
ncbi:MAG: CRTAC1 family protein, partial [Gemmatimonadota bacterium]